MGDVSVLGIGVEGKFWRAGLWGQPGGSSLGENKGSSGMSILGLRYKVAGQNWVEEKWGLGELGTYWVCIKWGIRGLLTTRGLGFTKSL